MIDAQASLNILCKAHQQPLMYICNYEQCKSPLLLCNHRQCVKTHSHQSLINLTSLDSVLQSLQESRSSLLLQSQQSQQRVHRYFDTLTQQMLKIIDNCKEEALTLLKAMQSQANQDLEQNFNQFKDFVNQNSNYQRPYILQLKNKLLNLSKQKPLQKIKEFQSELKVREERIQEQLDQLTTKRSFHKLFLFKTGRFTKFQKLYRSNVQGDLWHHYPGRTDAISFFSDQPFMLAGYIQCEVEMWPNSGRINLNVKLHKNNQAIHQQEFTLLQSQTPKKQIQLFFSQSLPIQKGKLYELSMTNEGDYFKTKRANLCKSRSEFISFSKSQLENNGKNQFSGQFHGLLIYQI